MTNRPQNATPGKAPMLPYLTRLLFGFSCALALCLSACGGKANANANTSDPAGADDGADDENCTGTDCTDGEANDDDDDDDDNSAPDDDATPNDDPLLEDPGEPEVPGFVRPDDDTEPEDQSGCDATALEDGDVTTGRVSFDAFFAATSLAHERSEALADATDAAFARLEDIVTSTDATPESILEAFHSAVDLNTVDGAALFLWAPRCPSPVNAMIDFLALCDADFDAPVDVDCRGGCVFDEGVDCSEGRVSCREADSEECVGSCEGRCEVNLEADGTCPGACSGTCVYTPSDGTCTADASYECRAEGNASVPCPGDCDGALVPPDALPECEAAARATAWLEAECSATTPIAQYEIAENLDADADVAFETMLGDFLSETATVLVLGQEARLTLQAESALVDDAAAIEERLQSEASNVDADSDEAVGLACGMNAVQQIPFVLGSAGATLNSVLIRTSAFVGGL